MANWHQKRVALVSGMVVINKTLGRKTENLLLDLAYACCNHLLFEVSRKRAGILFKKPSFFECTKQFKCLDAVVD